MSTLLFWILLATVLILAISMPLRRLLKKQFRQGIPYQHLQILLGLLLLIYVLERLSPSYGVLRWLIPIPLAALALYLFQELFAGLLFRLLYRLQPGQQVRIGTNEGRLLKLETNQLYLQADQTLIRLPYARILWQEVKSLQLSADDQHQSLQISWLPPAQSDVSAYQQQLHRLLLLWPHTLPGSEPRIRYQHSPSPHFEISLSLATQASAEQLQAYLKQYCRES